MRIKVCKVDQLQDGTAKSVRILARTAAVFRVAGKFYGLEADCKHMRASVANGKLTGTVITCPMHGWQYDIATGKCLNEPWAVLKTYPVLIEDNLIYIDFEP